MLQPGPQLLSVKLGCVASVSQHIQPLAEQDLQCAETMLPAFNLQMVRDQSSPRQTTSRTASSVLNIKAFRHSRPLSAAVLAVRALLPKCTQQLKCSMWLLQVSFPIHWPGWISHCCSNCMYPTWPAVQQPATRGIQLEDSCLTSMQWKFKPALY